MQFLGINFSAFKLSLESLWESIAPHKSQEVTAIPELEQTQSEQNNLDTFTKSEDQRELNVFSHQRHKALSSFKNGLPHDESEHLIIDLPVKDENTDTKPQTSEIENPLLDTSAKESEPSNPLAQDGEAEDQSTSSGEIKDKGLDGKELTDEEQKKVDEMQDRHEEVQTHENLHKSVGGSYAQAPSYTYETGPDGKRYITDGEVSIDVSKEDDPQKTIEKMQVVRRAALAPAEPSSADRQVAAEASQLEAEARAELAEENQDKLNSTSSTKESNHTSYSAQDQSLEPDEVNPKQDL